MNDLKFAIQECDDLDGSKTEAISIDVDRLYTVSEFIALLEKAKEKWGDKQVLIHDLNTGITGGFSTVFLHHGYDHREEYGEEYYQDDTICIFS